MALVAVTIKEPKRRALALSYGSIGLAVGLSGE